MGRVLYLETSIWSRLVEVPVSPRRRITEQFVDQVARHHRIVISDMVDVELAAIPDVTLRTAAQDRLWAMRPRVARFRAEAERVALDLLRMGRWSPRRFADLMHVAYTVLEDADALVTWDVADLARGRPRRIVHAYTRARGMLTPLIETPEEVSRWLVLKIQP